MKNMIPFVVFELAFLPFLWVNDRWQPCLVGPVGSVFQTFQAPNESLPDSTTFHHGKAFKGGVSFFWWRLERECWRCEMQKSVQTPLLQNSSKDLTKALGSSWIIHLMTCLPVKRSLFAMHTNANDKTFTYFHTFSYWSRGFSLSSRQEFGLALKALSLGWSLGLTVYSSVSQLGGCPSWASLCSLKSLHCNGSKLIGSHATTSHVSHVQIPNDTSAVRTGVVGPWGLAFLEGLSDSWGEKQLHWIQMMEPLLQVTMGFNSKSWSMTWMIWLLPRLGKPI